MKTEKIATEKEALHGLLEFLLELEQRKIEIWKSELAEMPKGTLCMQNRKGKMFYQIEVNGKRRGITRDIDLIYKLARKRYLQVLLMDQKEALKFVHDLSGKMKIPSDLKRKPSFLEKLMERYAKAGLTILRITCSEKQYQWVMANYRCNTMNPEEKKYETYSGIKVRSKSEQSIGNALEIRGIPYRYEMELSVKVDWMKGVMGISPGGYKKYYPDFVVPLPTGELLIWEHLGRVDLESYRAHNMEKISAYRQNDICDDEHLILTFEKDLERPETLNKIIATRVLRYM